MVFDLTSVWLLILLGSIMWGFWQMRRVAELARSSAKQYCHKHHLQLLSVALNNWQVKFNNGIKITMFFDLNYSANGLSAAVGEIKITNGRVEQISHWS